MDVAFKLEESRTSPPAAITAGRPCTPTAASPMPTPVVPGRLPAVRRPERLRPRRGGRHLLVLHRGDSARRRWSGSPTRPATARCICAACAGQTGAGQTGGVPPSRRDLSPMPSSASAVRADLLRHRRPRRPELLRPAALRPQGRLRHGARAGRRRRSPATRSAAGSWRWAARSAWRCGESHRKAAGLEGGETVKVQVGLDTAPRTVAAPADLLRALKARAGRPRRLEGVQLHASARARRGDRGREEARDAGTPRRRGRGDGGGQGRDRKAGRPRRHREEALTSRP